MHTQNVCVCIYVPFRALFVQGLAESDLVLYCTDRRIYLNLFKSTQKRRRAESHTNVNWKIKQSWYLSPQSQTMLRIDTQKFAIRVSDISKHALTEHTQPTHNNQTNQTKYMDNNN